jgi:hypothetical protein
VTNSINSSNSMGYDVVEIRINFFHRQLHKWFW